MYLDLNIFDHNVGAYAVPAVQSDYLNSPPVYPNVATDFGMMSVFWLKNNANIMARNVACCSPGSAIGFWMVPQVISQLRGPSTVCLGSEPLGLPGFGSRGSATECNTGMGGLSQAGNCNADGALLSVAGGDGTHTACWVPDDFVFPLARPDDRCLGYSTSNTVVPWQGFMENVCYCTFMLMGEMPEMIKASSLPYSMAPDGAIGLGAQIQDDKSRAQWMPFNGQTACTDQAVGIYCESKWDEGLPYQPLTAKQLTDADAWTETQLYHARSIPKILSGVLTFCTGGFQSLWGGVAWAKQMAAWTLNCAYIDPAAGSANPKDLANGQGNTQPVCLATTKSTVFIQSVQATGVSYNKMYPVFHNFISNGTISMPPSPSLWLGDKTFIADTALMFAAGEEGVFEATTSVEKHFCDFGSLGIADIFPNPLPVSPDVKNIANPPSVYLYDVKNSQLATVDWSSGNWSASSQTFPAGGNQVKFPFVCNDDKLRLASDGLQPGFNAAHNLGEATANLVTAQFYTQASHVLGDAICAGIFKIPPNLSAQGWP